MDFKREIIDMRAREKARLKGSKNFEETFRLFGIVKQLHEIKDYTLATITRKQVSENFETKIDDSTEKIWNEIFHIWGIEDEKEEKE